MGAFNFNIGDVARALGNAGVKGAQAYTAVKQKELTRQEKLQELARQLLQKQAEMDYKSQVERGDLLWKDQNITQPGEQRGIDNAVTKEQRLIPVKNQGEVDKITALYGKPGAPGVVAEGAKAAARIDAEAEYATDPITGLKYSRMKEASRPVTNINNNPLPAKDAYNIWKEQSDASGANYLKYMKLKNDGNAKPGDVQAQGKELMRSIINEYVYGKMMNDPQQDAQSQAKYYDGIVTKLTKDPASALQEMMQTKDGLSGISRQYLNELNKNGWLTELVENTYGTTNFSW